MAIVAFVAIYFVHRIVEFRNFTVDMVERYQDLNARYPFSAPDPTGPISEMKLLVYFDVREKMIDSISDDFESNIRTALEDDAKDMSLFRLFRASFRFLSASTQAHLEALERKRMSLEEYLWIHGLVMRDVMARDRGDPAHRRLVEALRNLENINLAMGGSDPVVFDEKDYTETLREAYKDYGPIGATAIGPFNESLATASLIDVLAGSWRLMEEAGLATSATAQKNLGATGN